MPNVGVNVTVFKLDLSPDDVKAIRSRFRRATLFGGPCLILSRDSGLALDSTGEPTVGMQPLLWTTHGLPWQQWNLRRARRGKVKIFSGVGNLALTALSQPHDWSPVTLRNEDAHGAQEWRLRPTEDGAAFLIEHGTTDHALDAGQEAENLRQPHLWSTHWATWQQWIVCRLPFPTRSFRNARSSSVRSPSFLE